MTTLADFVSERLLYKGAEMIEHPAYDSPDRESYLVGQSAVLVGWNIREAIGGVAFPHACRRGFYQEQFDCEQVVAAMKGNPHAS